MNIALIGCGKMGSAILQSWTQNKHYKHIYVIDPSPAAQSFESKTVSVLSSVDDFVPHIDKVDAIIFAVKPQIIGSACKNLSGQITQDHLVISIAAGTPISLFESHFGKKTPVIRSMPNTPAAIGAGMTVMTGNKAVTHDHRALASQILGDTGLLEYTEDETLMDAVTAISGSGPAYVFLMIEALAKSGEKLGLPSDFAMTLARQTVIGSAKLAGIEKDTDAATLRKNVTSPGGTTEAALDRFMQNNNIFDLFDAATSAAKDRSIALREK